MCYLHLLWSLRFLSTTHTSCTHSICRIKNAAGRMFRKSILLRELYDRMYIIIAIKKAILTGTRLFFPAIEFLFWTDVVTLSTIFHQWRPCSEQKCSRFRCWSNAYFSPQGMPGAFVLKVHKVHKACIENDPLIQHAKFLRILASFYWRMPFLEENHVCVFWLYCAGICMMGLQTSAEVKMRHPLSGAELLREKKCFQTNWYIRTKVL